MKNRLWWILIPLALLGCSQKGGIDSLRFTGTVEMDEYSIGFPVSGRIEQVFVEEEQLVKQGEIIATLEHFEQARRDFERSQSLVGSGGVSKQEYEHDKVAMEDQRAVSPIDGIVLTKVRENGEVVAAGGPVVVMGNLKNLWVRVYVPEYLISKIFVDQKARIYVDGLDKELMGHVAFIGTNAEFTPRNIQTPEERATQTFAVKISLENPQLSLHPGVAADVYFEGKKD